MVVITSKELCAVCLLMTFFVICDFASHFFLVRRHIKKLTALPRPWSEMSGGVGDFPPISLRSDLAIYRLLPPLSQHCSIVQEIVPHSGCSIDVTSDVGYEADEMMYCRFGACAVY